MLLTTYGLREWLGITVVAALLATGPVLMDWWWAVAIVVIAWIAVLSFFRDPIRSVPRDLPEGVMLSPADGRVSAVIEADHHEAVDGPATVVRIFLSVLNVHVNRSVADGEVVRLDHRPGTFLDARSEESARTNESNLIVLRLDDGRPLGMRQVAGKVARRIVCRLQVGDRVERGRKFGMIKFGSTAELIMPRQDGCEPTVHVTVGQRVRGGLTLLATLPPRDG